MVQIIQMADKIQNTIWSWQPMYVFGIMGHGSTECEVLEFTGGQTKKKKKEKKSGSLL